MKRLVSAFVLVLVMLLCAAPPAPAGSRWVVAKWVPYESSNYTAVDLDLGLNPSWMSENYDLYTRYIVANFATHNWVLMRINYWDYATLQADNNVHFLPDFPLDAKISAMSAECKNMCDAALTDFGIPDCMTGQEAYRDFLRCIGRQIAPNWSEEDWPY